MECFIPGWYRKKKVFYNVAELNNKTDYHKVLFSNTNLVQYATYFKFEHSSCLYQRFSRKGDRVNRTKFQTSPRNYSDPVNKCISDPHACIEFKVSFRTK